MACTLTQRKAIEVPHFVKKHDIDIIFITESGRKNSRPPPCLKGFHVAYNQTDISTRGILAYIRKDIPFEEKHHETHNSETKMIRIGNIHLIGIYRRHRNQVMEEELIFFFENPKTLVIGDWNTHNTLWDSARNNEMGNKLESYANDNLDIRTPSEYIRKTFNNTGNPSIIDFAIVKGIRKNNL